LNQAIKSRAAETGSRLFFEKKVITVAPGDTPTVGVVSFVTAMGAEFS
jgi:hypothetical protein